MSSELKSSNNTKEKLLENNQNNEKELNNYTNQNDLIKKKIKLLKEKEEQLDKINEQLKKSLSFITGKYDNKFNNNYILKSLTGEQNINEIQNKIKEFNKENEILTDKLKENKNIIINLKKKIGEMTDSKKNSRKNSININYNQNNSNNIIKLKDLKEKINEHIKDIKKQNNEYITLEDKNKVLEKRIQTLKKQIKDDENNNLNKINTKIISKNNNDNYIEKEKYIKIKEKNNDLQKLLEQLNKVQNNKEDKLKEILFKINNNNLLEIINDEDKEEKEMIDYINKNMNLLLNRNI